MEILSFIHERLSVTMLLFMLALGVWGLWEFLRGTGVSGSYWGALAIGQGVIMLQALIGVLLLFGAGRPLEGWLHYLYGIVAVITLPGMYTFTGGRSTRYESIIYALTAFFLLGITIRAQTTGGM
jgi:hypothetical protein